MHFEKGWLLPLLIVLMLAPFSFPLGAPAVRAAVLYDSGNPTAEEQLVLEYINRARADPVAEGQRLGIDIHEGLTNPSYVGPRPPLAMNKILLGIAQTHSQNMYNQNYFSHNDPNGMTPFDRMTNAGYNYVTAGENIGGALGYSATELEDLLMVDAGTPGRGHRLNLLDLFNPYPCGGYVCVYYEVGIGYYGASSPDSMGLNSLLTQDFGTSNVGPFLLGVVYDDQNHNNFYDAGEGIAGVTITPSSGGYYAVSSASGGYAIPVGTSGSITITATGTGFGSVTKTVTLNGANMKVDFTTATQTTSSSTTSTTIQTSTTSTVFTTSSTTTTAVTTSSTQTTTSSLNPPFIALNPTAAQSGSTVSVTGTSFSLIDTSCSLSGIVVGTFSCSISSGALLASFVVANALAGPYAVAAIGSPVGDYAWVIFTVSPSTSETTTSTQTSSTLTGTSVSSSQTTNQTNQSTTVSSYTTSQATTLATMTTSTQVTTTSGQTSIPDFLLTASSNVINLAQSSTGNLVVSLQAVGSFDQEVNLETVGLPGGVQISFSPNPVIPSNGGTITSTATLTVTRSVPTGIYPFLVVARSSSVAKQITLSLQVSGCLIATATFGSELAPEVQFLRDFRDDKILRTFAGSSFMVAFNTWYYSFSPAIAQYESVNPTMRLLVKIAIYPLIWILQFGSFVFDIFPNREAGATFSGVTISALLGAVYFTPPLMILRRRLSARMLQLLREFEKGGAILLAGALVVSAFSELLRADIPMAIGSSIIILSTTSASGLWISRNASALLKASCTQATM